MFNEEFIRDEGKIRNCNGNLAKMNISEYIVFNKFFIYEIKDALLECLKLTKDGFIGLLALIFNILGVIVFPITMPLMAYARIRYAKQQVKNKL